MSIKNRKNNMGVLLLEVWFSFFFSCIRSTHSHLSLSLCKGCELADWMQEKKRKTEPQVWVNLSNNAHKEGLKGVSGGRIPSEHLEAMNSRLRCRPQISRTTSTMRESFEPWFSYINTFVMYFQIWASKFNFFLTLSSSPRMQPIYLDNMGHID